MYNSLDSLCEYGDTLQESIYTAESWAIFAAALSSGKTARDQNYSNAVPADTLLGAARDTLQEGIDGLVEISTAVDIPPQLPASFELSQNFPNPFNPATVIKYFVPQVSAAQANVAQDNILRNNVSLKIYDLLGQLVATLVDETKSPGEYSARWDATNVPGGMYFYRMQAGGFSEVKKMMLLK